jgi:hypothetical protein
MSCSTRDAGRLNKLYRKYVSANGDVDVSRLRKAVRREALSAERGTIRVSAGLVRELRADRAEIGRLAKRCH